ncbi:Carbamoyl-phosphate synthase (glutamine-hydrolyzing) [Kluyveromyces marxianus]
MSSLKTAAPKAKFSIFNSSDSGPESVSAEFQGYSFGAPVSCNGEAVFTTSLVGYPESMTDPSYKSQILVFTQPLIGNYGVPDTEARDEFNLLKYLESPHIHVRGIVVAEYAWRYSHWTAVESLAAWCKRENVTAIGGVDTRAVVQILREQGSSPATIEIQGSFEPKPVKAETDLVKTVSTKEPFFVKALPSVKTPYNVALIDCGVKENIIRCLVERGANVTVFPYDYPITSVANQFDGIFISNGPGDPIQCMDSTVPELQNLLQTDSLRDIPIFGICLGHQLLALASGAKTVKLGYGNRAHNIPALDLTTGQCYITSQNHGYAVDADTLPSSEFKPFFQNLNDKSNEGMIHVSRPVFSTQFHPEAKGGPRDSAVLFDRYFCNMASYKASRGSKIKFSLDTTSMSTERVF